MVTTINMPAKKIKIFKGETPLEELQQAFTDELTGIMKDAAIRLKCNPEQLKYRVDSLGVVEVVKMDPVEMNDMENQRLEDKRKRDIRNARS